MAFGIKYFMLFSPSNSVKYDIIIIPIIKKE